MTTNKEASIAKDMHRNYFDRASLAIRDGYYLEALMYEYAAIEGRLEVICGMLDCPCNKNLDPNIRRQINIGNRINCLTSLYKHHPACSRNSTSKLSGEFWVSLKNWLKSRNQYVHGLYKNPDLYTKRITDRSKLASEGLRLSRLLYNEAKRIRRLRNDHLEMMEYSGKRCKNKQCF